MRQMEKNIGMMSKQEKRIGMTTKPDPVRLIKSVAEARTVERVSVTASKFSSRKSRKWHEDGSIISILGNLADELAPTKSTLSFEGSYQGGIIEAKVYYVFRFSALI